MKLTKSLMIVTLASGTVCAQISPNAMQAVKKSLAPTTHSAAPQAKPTPAASKATTVPMHAQKPAGPAMHAMEPAKKPVMAEKKPVMPAKRRVSKVEKRAESPVAIEKQASAKETTVSRVSATTANRRDPFVSPIVRATTTGRGPACETGKRCLVVDQIQLKGIVKSPNGYIAVVENPLKRAYFLRENDPVFNGSVIKITGDSVTFREMTTDKLGKQSMREVVKKVNAPVV